MLNRRQLLASTPAMAVVGLPGRGRARAAADRKFVFVFARGGWDPTRALADGFDHRRVRMEPGAGRAEVGGLRFVDHPQRPSVRAFFEAHASRSVVIEGVMVRSIAHDVCTAISMTGNSSRIAADWPAVIGAAAAGRAWHAPPVLGAPGYPGGPGLAGGTPGSLAAQAAVAVDALSRGESRCATLLADAGATGWDSHAHNDEQQSPLWEQLFAGLGGLMATLHGTPGTAAATLAEETVVVVFSEMGRTPTHNALAGKDHWPFTSVLLVGNGLTGGRNVGGWDEHWYGRNVDPGSGELSDGGEVPSAGAVGATLLALADVDPAEFASGASPLGGILA